MCKWFLHEQLKTWKVQSISVASDRKHKTTPSVSIVYNMYVLVQPMYYIYIYHI